MNNQQLIDKFKALHQQYNDLVNEFPIENREKVLFDKWSLKDILAHVTGWNDLNAAHAVDVSQGIEPEWVADVDKYNDEQVSKRKDLSWDEVYNEFIKSGDALGGYKESGIGREHGKYGLRELSQIKLISIEK